MDELTAFVKARLDEDEATAKACADFDEFACADVKGVHLSTARVLREVAAKRAILARHHDTWNDYRDGDGIERTSHECAECEPSGSPDDWPCETIRDAAAVWSDHPDYRAEWAA